MSRRCARTRGFGDFWSYCLVAEGAVDIAVEPEVKLWDLAALDVLVREAGGTFTSVAGQAGPHGGSAIATNGLLHDAVLAVEHRCRHGDFLGLDDRLGRDHRLEAAEVLRREARVAAHHVQLAPRDQTGKVGVVADFVHAEEHREIGVDFVRLLQIQTGAVRDRNLQSERRRRVHRR